LHRTQLGGALATIAADWISHKRIAKPILYTFVSPRVGFNEFSQSITTKLGTKNIFRAHHKTDVVSMVPLWPFLHAPNPGIECYLNNPGSVPGIQYHYIKSYIKSLLVLKAENWSSLRKPQPTINYDAQIENWLKSDSPLTFSTNSFSLLNMSLIYILKKILHLTGIAFQGALTGGLTFIDLLARFFSQVINRSKDALSLITSFINKILRILGKSIVNTSNITSDFIRWVLSALASSLYRLVGTAVNTFRP
jgi:hypothetical protein